MTNDVLTWPDQKLQSYKISQYYYFMISAVVALQIEIRPITSIGDHPLKEIPRGATQNNLQPVSLNVCDDVVFPSKVLFQPHICPFRCPFKLMQIVRSALEV